MFPLGGAAVGVWRPERGYDPEVSVVVAIQQEVTHDRGGQMAFAQPK
jgi:hypothetical protein